MTKNIYEFVVFAQKTEIPFWEEGGGEKVWKNYEKLSEAKKAMRKLIKDNYHWVEGFIIIPNDPPQYFGYADFEDLGFFKLIGKNFDRVEVHITDKYNYQIEKKRRERNTISNE